MDFVRSDLMLGLGRRVCDREVIIIFDSSPFLFEWRGLLPELELLVCGSALSSFQKIPTKDYGISRVLHRRDDFACQ